MSDRWLNLQLDDSTGSPFVRRPYVLRWASGEARGRTSADGRVSIRVPTGVTTMALYFAHRCFDLEFDALPHVDSVEGAQSRLNNLHFHVGPADGILGGRTAEALKAFQGMHGLEQTGTLDTETIDQIKQEHGT